MKKLQKDIGYKTPIEAEPVKKVPRWHKPRKRSRWKGEAPPPAEPARSAELAVYWDTDEARFKGRER